MAPDLETVKKLLVKMVEAGASDLHIRAHGPAYMRIDGQLKPMDGTQFSADDMETLMEELLVERRKTVFEQFLEVDFSYFFPGVGRFRCNGYREKGNPALVMRHVLGNIPGFDSLHLPPSVKTLAEQKWGLVLVTGPTGHGKSTTLASIIDYISQTRASHVVTIEDPVEYMFEDKKSIVSQRELGDDTLSFANALKHVLRQDPNVIMVGEMRDLDTVETVMKAAETGHLVLSTLHTTDAVQTLSRIVDMFPPAQQAQARVQLAGVLRGVVSQKLLPLAAGAGRIPACEVLVVTGLVKTAILKNEASEIYRAIQQGTYYGMQTFLQSLLKLLNEGSVKLQDALEAASNPEELMMAVKGIQTGTVSTQKT
jgi:twitching motility protein PilT